MMVKKFRKLALRDRADSITTTSEDGTEMSSGTRRENMARLEHTITKMFLVVMAAVLGCYGPSTIFIYTMSFCEDCSCAFLHWCRDLQFLFIIMNSSLNFFCYALRSPRFRQAFAYILTFK